jgi:hypothetical protein
MCVLFAGAILLLNARPPGKPPGAADSEDSRSQNWGNPVRVSIIGENQEVQTTFVVGLKDAWYTDCGPSVASAERNTFVVVYYYKNLGPREELEPLAWGDVRKEIRTDKGHIFPGDSLRGSPQALFTLPEPKRDVFWWARETRKIEETGESALVFAIPKDEVPTEVRASGRIARGRVDLDLQFPKGRRGFRIYSEAFGFLPQKPEKAVPIFVEALQENDQNMRGAALDALGAIGPAAKEAVPTICNILLNHKEHGEVCSAAARTLGRIGPAASESLPVLNRFRQQSPLLKGLAFVGLRRAIYEALENIGSAKDATVAITEDLHTADILTSAEAFDELAKLAPTVPQAVLAIADVVSHKNQDWHRRIDAAKFLGNLGTKAKEAVPDLKMTLRELELMGARRWSSDIDLLAAIKEGLPKIDPNWESVAVAKPSETRAPEEPNPSSSESLKPTSPRGDNRLAHDVPPGLREGIDRLSQGLQARNDLAGSFSDYRLIVPPNYKGDETTYEIGFLRPGGTFYVFRTVDGGQTWSPLPATNPYLINVRNDAVEEARRKGTTGTPEANRATRGPQAESPRRPRNTGQPGMPGFATPSADEGPHPNGPLSGVWQSATGASCQLVDDGATAVISLKARTRTLLEFNGKLTRRNGESDSKHFEGSLNAVFAGDSKQHVLRTTATLDDADHLRLRFPDWPIYDKRGKLLGERPYSETLTRSDDVRR